MRRVAIALLATAGIALATPALAQGIYIGPGGFGVGPGYHGEYYGGGYAPEYQYGSGYRGYGESYGYSREYRRCRTIMVQTPNGNLRRVRRCS